LVLYFFLLYKTKRIGLFFSVLLYELSSVSFISLLLKNLLDLFKGSIIERAMR